MTTNTAIDIGDFIITNPAIRQGRPTIKDTGVTVQRIVEWYQHGETPEEIAENIFGHLSLAQVFAALTYFHANRMQIENQIIQDKKASQKAEEKWHKHQQ